eukprot:403343442
MLVNRNAKGQGSHHVNLFSNDHSNFLLRSNHTSGYSATTLLRSQTQDGKQGNRQQSQHMNPQQSYNNGGGVFGLQQNQNSNRDIKDLLNLKPDLTLTAYNPLLNPQFQYQSNLLQNSTPLLNMKSQSHNNSRNLIQANYEINHLSVRQNKSMRQQAVISNPHKHFYQNQSSAQNIDKSLYGQTYSNKSSTNKELGKSNKSGGVSLMQSNVLQNIKNQQLYTQVGKTLKSKNQLSQDAYSSEPASTDYLQLGINVIRQEKQDLNNLNDYYRPRQLKQMLIRQQQSIPLLEQNPSQAQSVPFLPRGSSTVFNSQDENMIKIVDDTGVTERQLQSAETSPARNKFLITPEIYKQIQNEEKLKSQLKNQPNMIQIRKRMFEIKKNQKKMPRIDFTLKLDAYHASGDNCLHCKRNALHPHIYQYKCENHHNHQECNGNQSLDNQQQKNY